MLILIALAVTAMAAILWMIEISIALDRSEKILRSSPTLYSKLCSIPDLTLSFFPFALDVAITAAFIGLLGISGVTGFVSGCFCSNLFSIFILKRVFTHRKAKFSRTSQPWPGG